MKTYRPIDMEETEKIASPLKSKSSITPLETLVYDITTMIGNVQRTLGKHSLIKEHFLSPKGFKASMVALC